MNIQTLSFLNANGLFDFDLTFPLEILLFFSLAVIVTFVFLSPISKQLTERAEFIDYNLRKSTILLTFGYDKLSDCVGLLTQETNEMNRQVKLVRNYTNSKFELEIAEVQKQNLFLLSEVKGDLAIKSAYLFSTLTSDLKMLTDKFFTKKFQSI